MPALSGNVKVKILKRPLKLELIGHNRAKFLAVSSGYTDNHIFQLMRA